MNSTVNDIFSSTGCLSAASLVAYRDGKLDKESQHEAEKHLIDCVLCSEALEGIQLLNNNIVLNETRYVINNLAGNTHVSFYRITKFWAVAASVATIAVLSILLKSEFDSARERTSQVVLTNEEATENDKFKNEDELVTIDNALTTDSGAANASEKISIPSIAESTNEEQAQSQIPVQSKREDKIGNDSESGVLYQSTLESIKVEKEVSAGEVPPGPEIYSEVKDDVIYLEDLKVAVNKPANEKTATGNEILERSTSSQYQNKAAKTADAAPTSAMESVAVKSTDTYESLLKEGLIEYKKNHYQNAISNFERMAMMHPGDLNATFYNGMSNYYIGNYTEAVSLLGELSGTNKDNPFLQEARFYYALSLFYAGNREQGLNLLKRISTENNFYSDRAADSLKELR